MPMHVGGLQLFEKPEGAGRNYVREMYEQMRDVDGDRAAVPQAPAPLAHAPPASWCWVEDDQFDIEHHVRHSALPKPGRVRELLELCSRLHSTRLAWERPLWEAHLIEGLRDGRVAMYTKIHHALVDGVSAMRLLQSVLSTDPDERDMPAAVGAPRPRRRPARPREERRARPRPTCPIEALRTALGITAEAAGLPGALIKTLTHGLRNETSALSLYAPRTILNQHDHRVAPLRRPGLADRAAAGDRQGHRHHAERRGAGDVQRRDAHLPARARRAARRAAGLDGAGRAQRQAVADRLRRRAATPSAR